MYIIWMDAHVMLLVLNEYVCFAIGESMYHDSSYWLAWIMKSLNEQSN